MVRVKQTTKVNINHQIRAKEVRLIDAEGKQVGIVATDKALSMAVESGLDLVEVSPSANPPVCKIMDYGRYKYEQTKKQQEAKKKQSSFQVKEIKVRPKTGEHDLNVKLGHMRKFIEKKDKVKVSVMFRGREIALSELAKELLFRVADAMKDVAIVEQHPEFEGRNMVMILSPK